MILRFKSSSSEPEYLAINTEQKTYTTDVRQVDDGMHTVMALACNHFNHLKGEVNFNCYDYTENLTAHADYEPLPF